jgi:hypothetical protein
MSYYDPDSSSNDKAIQKAEKKARGLERLAGLRQSLDMAPVSEASRESIEKLDAIFEGVGA